MIWRSAIRERLQACDGFGEMFSLDGNSHIGTKHSVPSKTQTELVKLTRYKQEAASFCFGSSVFMPLNSRSLLYHMTVIQYCWLPSDLTAEKKTPRNELKVEWARTQLPTSAAFSLILKLSKLKLWRKMTRLTENTEKTRNKDAMDAVWKLLSSRSQQDLGASDKGKKKMKKKTHKF